MDHAWDGARNFYTVSYGLKQLREYDRDFNLIATTTTNLTGPVNIWISGSIINVVDWEDGTVKKMEGTANVPSPTDYMEFTNPIQADLGYYSGKFLNDNWDLEILLVDERFYLAFRIGVTVEMKVGAKSDPEATSRPFVIL